MAAPLQSTFALDAKQASELLASMPPVYREVLVLRFVDGLGPKEISDLIEETENVVSVRLHRGLKLLRSHIEAAEERGNLKRRQWRTE
jgi:RNA polymerase sigma-70 factor, ECF subfamily